MDPSLEARVNVQDQAVVLEEQYEVSRNGERYKLSSRTCSSAAAHLSLLWGFFFASPCRSWRRRIWMNGRTYVVLVPGRTPDSTRNSSGAGRTDWGILHWKHATDGGGEVLWWWHYWAEPKTLKDELDVKMWIICAAGAWNLQPLLLCDVEELKYKTTGRGRSSPFFFTKGVNSWIPFQ